MKREVVKIGADVLRQVAEPAENNDYAKQVIQDLKDTLLEIPNGAGLAAPQIGESIRIFSTRDYIDNDRNKILIFINPEIIESSEQTVTIPDGCLSIPMVSSITNRNSFIKVRYLDENFEQQEKEFEGFQSVVFQHENDHLDGILFLDRLPKEQQETLEKFWERRRNGENVMFSNGKIIEINIDFNKIIK
jgi:peptide deformylase